MEFIVTEMKETDWLPVSDIYTEGINTKIATFQSTAPSWEDWNNGHCKTCRLVAKSGEEILGWAALSPVSSRCVYAGVAELSIYIANKFRGKKVGTALLEEIIKRSEENGYWTLQSGIIRENIASLSIHKKCGFREIGYREKVGKMDTGTWHDVVLVERRSKVTGI